MYTFWKVSDFGGTNHFIRRSVGLSMSYLSFSSPWCSYQCWISTKTVLNQKEITRMNYNAINHIDDTNEILETRNTHASIFTTCFKCQYDKKVFQVSCNKCHYYKRYNTNFFSNVRRIYQKYWFISNNGEKIQT